MKNILFILMGAVCYHFHLWEMDHQREQASQTYTNQCDERIAQIEQRYRDSLQLVRNLHQAEANHLQQQLDAANDVIKQQTRDYQQKTSAAEARWSHKFSTQAADHRQQLQQQYDRLHTEHRYQMEVARQNSEHQKAQEIQQHLRQYREAQLQAQTSPLSLIPDTPWQNPLFLLFCYLLLFVIAWKALRERREYRQQISKSKKQQP